MSKEIVTEKIVEIGNGFSLSAVLTLPESVDANKPALVILNSGVMHRVGTCRTSVILARAVANSGTLVLRFDLSGIGDSVPRSSGHSDLDRANEEIISAMDYLQREFGINKFLMYGLCSGAQNSFGTALQDERIIGLAGIDGYAYRTLKFYRRKIAQRILKLSFWINTARRILAKFSKPENSDEDEMNLAADNMWPEYPPREEVEMGYQKLVSRGVEFLVIFTGGREDEYNYRDQFYDMYPAVDFKRQLELKRFPSASHIMAEPVHQEEILASIQNWVKTVSTLRKN